MEPACYRCNATLPPDAKYCQECGAPQIRYVAREEDAEPGLAKTIAASHAKSKDLTHSLSWKTTVRIAVLIAIAVGILCAVLAAGSVLWSAIGAIAVIGIYHRRRPSAILGTRIGARVGALVGFMVAAIALAANAVLLVVQRYGMHQGGQIDEQLTTIVKQAAEQAAKMDPQAPVAAFANFWLSAEGRVGLVLLTMGFLSLLILLFAIAGGVLGTQLYRPRHNKAIR